jgi:hypothetical protein
MSKSTHLLRGTIQHPGDNNLTEKSLLEFMETIRQPYKLTTPHLVVTQEGIDNVKALCAEDPEYRKRVLAEFPQLEGII